MRVAFDLDNTLVRGACAFPLAAPRRGLWQRMLRTERLRLGVRELFAFCRARGWEVWIYTTSYRSPGAIRRLLWVHGLQADGIVNQARHERAVRVRSSKHPPTFGLDVLVDDAPGVALEGKRFGFAVIQVEPTNAGWVADVQTRLLALAAAPAGAAGSRPRKLNLP